VLLGFPVATRVELANSVSKVVLSNEVKNASLSTAVHVRVVLEVVGQGLSLPLSAASTVEAGVRLYRRWLLDLHSRPIPIMHDDQFFCRQMLKHLSLVFMPRNYTVDDQAALVCPIAGAPL
jgi:hypothetical protein